MLMPKPVAHKAPTSGSTEIRPGCVEPGTAAAVIVSELSAVEAPAVREVVTARAGLGGVPHEKPAQLQVVGASEPRGREAEIRARRLAIADDAVDVGPPGVDGADVRLGQQPALEARHREVLGSGVVLSAGAHVEQADVLPAGLPGELGADVDLLRLAGGAEADSPAEKGDDGVAGLAREVERTRTFEEERALLGENGVPAATSAVVQQLVHAQIAAGEGEEDYSGLAKAIFKLANL